MCDLTIEEELYGNLFHDPNFFEHFLSGPPARLDAVLKYCRKTTVYTQRGNRWSPNTRVTRRSIPEPPLLKLINTIVRGVHSTTPSNPSASPAVFLDWPAQKAPTDMEECQLPNYITFDGAIRDWAGLRMAVKVMRLPGHRKMGMYHLSTYARKMFTEQLHRRHIYYLLVCGTEATFVRFDRAGVLYSSAIDLCKDAETFIRAFASLMMLDRADEGYDPYFSTKLNSDDLIVYYLDLPIEATQPESDADRRNSSTRKFQVREILCHRPEIVGNATTVLRLCDVLEPIKREVEPEPIRGKGKRKRTEPALVEKEERIGDTSYIMKITWRSARAVNESEIYEKVDGMYGLSQRVWARDASTRCTCANPNDECPTCVVEVGHIDGLEVCDILSNLIFSKEEFDPDGEDDEGPELDTNEYRPASRKRQHRIYSYVLMSSVGVPLAEAESPHQYMKAMLDAVLGYWRLFNLGYIHRDISDGNVLMLKPDQAFAWKEWENPSFELSEIEDEELRKSEEKLREVMAKLGRDPIGVLADFDLCSEHSASTPVETKSEIEFHAFRKRPRDRTPLSPRKRQRRDVTKCYSFRDTSEPPPDEGMENLKIDYRTGTTPFMSTSALGSTFGKPYRHSYLDDLESFFWLIYLSAVGHVDEGKRANIYQRKEVAIFDNPNMRKLANFKSQMVGEGDRLYSYLNLFENKWAKSYAFKTVLFALEDFFRGVWEERDPGLTPTEVFTKITGVLLTAIAG
ncbi:unnamed protein product [Rhizoctonia solani]|uniref:Fungal-type protein kinase domain-containing protein n=1 Tax=Rhizoctonia solani TaxID=456999 RepID=A0A8H2WSX2_9AGAM|nr:unnamed protein product [Rhizoctonia solani]